MIGRSAIRTLFARSYATIAIGNCTTRQLLHHITFGKKINLDSIKYLLRDYPTLLLETGNVVTPSGLNVVNISPYDCAIGTGDPAIVKMVASFFSKIEGGQAEKAKSDARYQPHIQKMLDKEAHHDLEPLVQTLRKATDEDVTKALRLDDTHQSDLWKALTKFKQDVALGEITIGMHCNNQDLKHAFDIYQREYRYMEKNALKFSTADGKRNRKKLFCIQIIGTFLKNLSALERFLIAQDNLEHVAFHNAPIERTYLLKNGIDNYPTHHNHPYNQLGNLFFIFKGRYHSNAPPFLFSEILSEFLGLSELMTYWDAFHMSASLEKHIANKHADLIALTSSSLVMKLNPTLTHRFQQPFTQ